MLAREEARARPWDSWRPNGGRVSRVDKQAMSAMTYVEPIVMFGGRIGYTLVGDVGITVFNSVEWTDAIAEEFMVECISRSQEQGVTHPRAGVTHIRGAPPGASQRRVILEVMKKHDVAATRLSAIISDSAVVRGAAVAFGWLSGSKMRAFAMHALAEAAAFVAEGDVRLEQQVAMRTQECVDLCT